MVLDLRLAVASGAAVLLLGAVGAYDPGSRLPGARLRMAAQLSLLGCTVTMLASLIGGGLDGTLSAARLALVAALLPAAWISARVAAAALERRHPARALVIGTGATAQHVWELSVRHPECAFRVVGFVDNDPLELPAGAPEALGTITDLPGIVARHDAQCVIVAYAKVIDADLIGVLRTLPPDVRVQVVPRLYELVQARGYELGRISVLQAGGIERGICERMVKRALDLVLATLLLALLAPVLLAIAIGIKLEDRGPVIFRQRRIGKDGRMFSILKFRTMTEGVERSTFDMVQGLPIEDAVRELKERSVELHATRIGTRLRSTSLDEVPQLWNVLRGHMSLVGPRPMTRYEVDALDPLQAATRHSVRPGLTGLWQVSGRGALTWDERVHLDCVYTRHWSVTSDMRILLRTVGVVLLRNDTV